MQWKLFRSQSVQIPVRVGDVTVALTGVSATGEAGNVTPKIDQLWCYTPPDTFFKACLRDAIAKIRSGRSLV